MKEKILPSYRCSTIPSCNCSTMTSYRCSTKTCSSYNCRTNKFSYADNRTRTCSKVSTRNLLSIKTQTRMACFHPGFVHLYLANHGPAKYKELPLTAAGSKPSRSKPCAAGITAFPEVKGMSDNREKQEKTVVTRSGVSIYRKRN
jgi:hypothetical protein